MRDCIIDLPVKPNCESIVSVDPVPHYASFFVFFLRALASSPGIFLHRNTGGRGIILYNYGCRIVQPSYAKGLEKHCTLGWIYINHLDYGLIVVYLTIL